MLTEPAGNEAGSLAELQLRIYWDEGGEVAKLEKAYLSTRGKEENCGA